MNSWLGYEEARDKNIVQHAFKMKYRMREQFVSEIGSKMRSRRKEGDMLHTFAWIAYGGDCREKQPEPEPYDGQDDRTLFL